MANAVEHISRARLLADGGNLEGAVSEAGKALEIEPDFKYARVLLVQWHSELALQHLGKAQQPYDSTVTPFTGTGKPLRVLQLGSVKPIGLTGTERILDPNSFETTTIIVQYWHPDREFPEHDVVFNAIADPDTSSAALDMAEWLLEKTSAPVINRPATVRATGRKSGAQRFGGLPGVIAPQTQTFESKHPNVTAPVILRAAGFHNGQHMVLVENPSSMQTALAQLPEGEVLAIRFVDTRSRDGRFRKYRAIAIDGELYPAHLAVSKDWNVHYFSAQMGDSEREEERAFLSDARSAIGEEGYRRLQSVASALDLQYCGIDFGLSPEGEVVVFEANAAMTIYVPEPGPDSDYRRHAALQIFEAARAMIKRVAS